MRSFASTNAALGSSRHNEPNPSVALLCLVYDLYGPGHVFPREKHARPTARRLVASLVSERSTPTPELHAPGTGALSRRIVASVKKAKKGHAQAQKRAHIYPLARWLKCWCVAQPCVLK